MAQIFFQENNGDVFLNTDTEEVYFVSPTSDAIYWYSFNKTDNLVNLVGTTNTLTEIIGTLKYDTNRLGTLSGATKATLNTGPTLSVVRQSIEVSDEIDTNSGYSFASWFKYNKISIASSFNPFNIYRNSIQFASLRVDCYTDYGGTYANQLIVANSFYGQGTVSGLTAASGLTDGWHHICFTNNINDDKILYLDGIELARNNISWDLYPDVTGYYLGYNQHNCSVYNFLGWDRTLSPSEVKTLYNVT